MKEKIFQEFNKCNDLESLIVIMRFNTLKPQLNSLVYLSYQKISSLTKIGCQQVKKICQQALIKQESMKENENKQKQKSLTQEQINFLTSQETLQKQAGKTLQERCTLFHRKYPEKFISQSKLVTLYKKFGIKRKVIRIKKYTTLIQDQKKEVLYQSMIEYIQLGLNEKRKLIFVDEVIFTYQTIPKYEFSSIYHNIEIQDKLFSHKCLAVVAAISIQSGLEEFYTFEKSINIENFQDFLLGLKDKNKFNKVTLMLDNLRVHHSKKVKLMCQSLDIQLIFTPPYSPEINPIENIFSLVKNIYKRQKIISLGKNEKFNPKQLIKRSFETIQKETIQELCKKKMLKLGFKFQ